MRQPAPRRPGIPGPFVALIAIGVGIAALFTGCVVGVGIGSQPDPGRSPVAATASSSRSAESVVAEPTTATPSARSTASPTASASPSTPAPTRPPAKIKVPDVVGANHQAAQNTMQAAGFFGLAEEDATGQGRALLWDRNWVVVRQSPKAGSKVSPDTTITLYSKKIGE
ncbi:PASTA domain-containing protein [Spirillospora sp. NBC_01491]|uniref:PASTA domain-containing protein n=1 Tax=Spirillospora sp. NBC_01491 TaxID=2976007 RepID=UPI002E36C637|nr:PASTA domain-containing protein [Spirillospora sp. NBC_01491]